MFRACITIKNKEVLHIFELKQEQASKLETKLYGIGGRLNKTDGWFQPVPANEVEPMLHNDAQGSTKMILKDALATIKNIEDLMLKVIHV